MKLPYKLKYTDKVKAGDAYMCFVRINPKYKGDIGIHAHEYEHIKQWYRLTLFAYLAFFVAMTFTTSIVFLAVVIPFLHNFIYTYSKAYRKDCEVNAFKAQLIYYPNSIDKIAWILASSYDLNITKDEALRLLSE